MLVTAGDFVKPLAATLGAVAEFHYVVRLPVFYRCILHHDQPSIRYMVWSLSCAPYKAITNRVKSVTDKSHLKIVTDGWLLSSGDRDI